MLLEGFLPAERLCREVLRPMALRRSHQQATRKASKQSWAPVEVAAATIAAAAAAAAPTTTATTTAAATTAATAAALLLLLLLLLLLHPPQLPGLEGC